MRGGVGEDGEKGNGGGAYPAASSAGLESGKE